MFTMQKIYRDKNAVKAYVHYFCHGDYYSEGGRRSGTWRGKLAADLGFGKEVTPEQLTEIGNGMWHGKKLTPGRSSAKTVCYHGWQCAPPKSVSIMAVVCRDDRIKQAHADTVAEALAEMEKFTAARLRTGDYHGTDAVVNTGNFACATFQHETSRALDPQLHTHCLIANVTRAPDGRLLALTESQICAAVGFCGRFYQNRLAEKIRALGYRLEPREKGFGIVGVPKSVETLYSKRSDEINAIVEKEERALGRPLEDAEIAVIAKETRKEKLKHISEPEVMDNCWRQLSKSEKAALTQCKGLAELSEQKQRHIPHSGEIIKHVNSVIHSHFERNTVSPKYEVIANVLAMSLGKFTREEIEAIVDRQLVQLQVGDTAMAALVSTPEAIARERNIVSLIAQGHGKHDVLGDAAVSNTVFSPDAKILSPAQQLAVRNILNNRDAVQVFRGVAGSGKTTTLAAIRRGIEGRAFFLAPTRSAVNVLKSEGFNDADTVAKFLIDPKITIGNKTTLFIDESSLLDAKTGYEILTRVKAAGARAVFIGDERQHVAVGAGDFLRIIEQHTNAKTTELSEIRRQRPEAYRKAIAEMAAGRTLSGLEQLKHAGAIEECAVQYLDKAAKHYITAVKDKKSVILVAPTHAEIDSMTAIIRRELIASGRLSQTDSVIRTAFIDYQRTAAQLRMTAGYEVGMAVKMQVNKKESILTVTAIDEKRRKIVLSDGSIIDPEKAEITGAGKLRELEFALGEKILLTANDKSRKITNGDIVEIVAIMPGGEILTDKGQAIPPEYLDIQYGYALTSYKSQGQTADVAIMAAAALDAKACYVGSSRGRQEVKIYCPEYQYLANRVAKPADRLAVLDVQAKS